MKNLERKILYKIKEEKIKPKSKSYFYIKSILALFSVIFMLFVSGFFTAGLFFVLSNKMLVGFIPVAFFVLIQITLFSLTLYLAYLQFKKIRNMYRRRTGVIFFILLFLIFVSSFFITRHRLYISFDSFGARNIPPLSFQNKVYSNWSNLQGEGRLAVEISMIDDDGYIYGEDFRGNIHIIDPILLNEEEYDVLLKYLRISMRGFEEEGIFYPEEIEPWIFKYKKNGIHPYYDKPIRNDNIEF